MKYLGLISKIQVHDHIIKGDFLNNIFVPAIKYVGGFPKSTLTTI